MGKNTMVINNPELRNYRNNLAAFMSEIEPSKELRTPTQKQIEEKCTEEEMDKIQDMFLKWKPENKYAIRSLQQTKALVEEYISAYPYMWDFVCIAIKKILEAFSESGEYNDSIPDTEIEKDVKEQKEKEDDFLKSIIMD